MQRRIAHICSDMLTGFRTKFNREKILQLDDLNTLANLTFVVPHTLQEGKSYPEYVKDEPSDSLRYLGRKLLEENDEMAKSAGAFCLDAYNAFPPQPSDSSLWKRIWENPETEKAWTIAYIGLTRTSPEEAVQALQKFFERQESEGWDGMLATWSFYENMLESLKKRSETEVQIQSLIDQMDKTRGRKFIAQLRKNLKAAGVPRKCFPKINS